MFTLEDWDMTLGEFLDRLTYEVRQVLSFKDRQDFFEERLNTLNKSFEDLNGKVIELRKSLDSLRNQHLEDRRSLSSHIEKRLEEIEERLESVEKFISEMKREREKKKRPLLKRILSGFVSLLSTGNDKNSGVYRASKVYCKEFTLCRSLYMEFRENRVKLQGLQSLQIVALCSLTISCYFPLKLVDS